MMRLRMSRPTSSVPNQCADDGPALNWETVVYGDDGAIHRAKTAASVITAITTRPATALRVRKKRDQNRPPLSSTTSASSSISSPIGTGGPPSGGTTLTARAPSD